MPWTCICTGTGPTDDLSDGSTIFPVKKHACGCGTEGDAFTGIPQEGHGIRERVLLKRKEIVCRITFAWTFLHFFELLIFTK
jgi:hypothetical protein